MSTESDEFPQPEYSEDGVDLSLIRWMLSLTPAERLEALQESVDQDITIRELYLGRTLEEKRKRGQ